MDNSILTVRPSADNQDWLPSGEPTSYVASGPATKSAVTLSIDTTGNMIQFTMQKTSGADSTGKTDQHGHFLFVAPDHDLALTINLSKDWNWSFDKNPLSFKKEGDAAYYRLHSAGPDSITIWAKSTGQSVPQTHGFNLYILMDQTKHRAFPIRVDPDLKNPPPPLMNQIASGPVPIV